MYRIGGRFITALSHGALPLTLVTAAIVGTQFAVDHLSGQAIPGLLSDKFLAQVLGAANFILGVILSAVLTRVALSAGEGETVPIGRLLAGGLATVIPVLILILLYSIGSALGCLLLVVPGLVFATAASIVVPVYVSERGNVIGSFKRAFQLTEGRRWQIFSLWLGVTLLTFILVPILAGQPILSDLHRFFPRQFPAGWSVAERRAFYALPWVTSLLTLVRVARIILNACIYLELRAEKDALTQADPVKVFE